MNTIMASIGSKQLMVAGVVLALIIRDAESRVTGWQWWHAISVAIITGCFCLAKAYQDKGKADNDAEKRLVDGGEPAKP